MAHVRRVTQEQFDAHTKAAVEKGVKSIIAVLRRKPPAIPDAFHHPRHGPIGLDFVGAKHIVDERMKQYPGDSSEATTAKGLRDVATAAILGIPQEDPADRVNRKTSRVAIVHGEHEVIVEPNWETKHPDLAKGQTLWLVTGYRMDAHRKKRRKKIKSPWRFDSASWRRSDGRENGPRPSRPTHRGGLDIFPRGGSTRQACAATRHRSREPLMKPVRLRIAQAVSEVEREPTRTQIEAGNYRKGHFTWNGMHVVIENPSAPPGAVSTCMASPGKRPCGTTMATFAVPRAPTAIL